jgi:catechol 2,3-dioxygenase-like lactoylglutathione lyase family enzyme
VTVSLQHIALFVPDLQAAEAYYQALFGMELIGREAERADGLWYTLPFDKGWAEAGAAGIELGLTALRKGDFVLALFAGAAPPGQVVAIGLAIPPEEIAAIRARLPADTQAAMDEPSVLEFRDRYEITWQIAAPSSAFRTSGELAGRWLEL